MIKFIRTTCCFMLTIVLCSCGSSDNTEAPNSTPIDSTNASGTAQVEYNNPDNKDKEMLPEEANGDKVNTPGGTVYPLTPGNTHTPGSIRRYHST